MPYYIFCRKCNSDGSYQDIDKNCSKCQGTGNAWQEDEELENYHKWLDVPLEKLKKEKIVTSKDGTKIFYSNSISTIKEEQANVIKFKEEPDLSQQKLEIAKKDLEARIKFFTKNFHLNSVKRLNKSSGKGNIDIFSLYISFVGINDELLSVIRNTLDIIEEKYKNHATSAIDVIEKQPELVSLIELQEVVSHEHFHLLQFLTCSSVNTFYKASRKHNFIRAYVLSEIIRQDVKIKINDGKTIFSSILDLSTDKIDYFNEIIENAKMESLIVTNFYTYKSKKTDLNIIDIFEGCAVAFQKLANHSEEIKTLYDIKLETSKIYFGAWNYFKEQGGSERMVFFAISYQSLKYGLLDDGNYMNVVPIPQDIFIMLCQNIKRYEDKLNSSFSLSQLQISVDKRLSTLNLTDEQASSLAILLDIFNIIKEDIRDYSKKVNTYHDDTIFERFIRYDDNFIYSPLKLISEKINRNCFLFDSEYFLPLLLIDYKFFSNFMFDYFPKALSEIEFQDMQGNTSNIASDNFFNWVVEDIDVLIRKGMTYCCDVHKKPSGDADHINERKVSSCESKNSLKNRFKAISGKELSSLFQ